MKRRVIFLSGILLGLWVTEARADAGLPMIFVSMKGMFYGIIPIILIEARLLARGLKIPGV